MLQEDEDRNSRHSPPQEFSFEHPLRACDRFHIHAAHNSKLNSEQVGEIFAEYEKVRHSEFAEQSKLV